LALALAAAACNAGGDGAADADAKVAPVEAKAPAEPPPVAPPPDDTCPDLSSLDVDALPALPKSKHRALLEQVWRVVLDKHFDPTLGCVDWPAKRVEYGEKLVGVSGRDEAASIIDQMLHELGQSHFRLFGAQTRDVPAPGPAAPPMQVRWIDDEVVVVASTATGHLGDVPPGAVVLAIDEQPVDAIVKSVGSRTSRPTELAFEIARAAASYLSCAREGQQRKVRITDPARDGTEVIRMVQCEAAKGELVTLGNLHDMPTRVEHRIVDEGPVGYLAFNLWMLPMVERVKAAMTDLRGKGMKGLVLDLRGNPGGVGPMSVPVARLLLSEPGSLGALKFRDFAQEFNVEPGEDPFVGPVAILIDEGTASTSEIFAQGLQDLGRVVVVGGGPSAGAALPSLIEELPGGAVLQYVVGDYHSPKGVVVEGKGVIPDILVDEDKQSFAEGHDEVLDTAVAHLMKELASAGGESPEPPAQPAVPEPPEE
jgi:carboxyl-terminal processing protease